MPLTIGHSPDPDDTFMWWPLQGAIDTSPFRFVAVSQDIEALNRRAVESADLDVTAMSFHTYAHAHGRYALTSCGASVGDGYGPCVIARGGRGRDWLSTPGLTFAVPGERTSAFLALRLLLGRPFRFVAMPFREVIPAVARGDADAGVLIHEAQLTFEAESLGLVVDLGAWWKERTGLPLPLGANALRRDLDQRFGPGSASRVAAILRRSIEHALGAVPAGVEHAAASAPGVPRETTARFISMYVNDLTVDLGDRGLAAVRRLLREGAQAGLCPDAGEIDVVRAG